MLDPSPSESPEVLLEREPESAPEAARPSVSAAAAPPFGFAALAPTEITSAEPLQTIAPSAVAAQTSASFDDRRDEPALGGFGQGFGGADVADALAATTSHVDPEGEVADDHDFVDPREARRQRAAATQSTIAAARAAMTEPEVPPGGLMRKGGKTRLQERLDRQAAKDGGVVKKALLASITAVVATGGVYGYLHLTDSPLAAAGAPDSRLIAASLTKAAPVGPSEGERVYGDALAALNASSDDAIATLTRAAELGYAPAQLHLARLFELGENGVAPDLVAARLWTQRAAVNGSERAMHNLGVMLYAGQGGGVDQAEAASWFRQAAERGLTDSQFNLAKLYADGVQGVAPAPEEALQWYLIAAAAGDTQARAEADRIAVSIAPARRAEIERAAEAFQAAG